VSIPDAPPATICVEVVYADAQGEVGRHVDIASGTTVQDAIETSGIRSALPPGFTLASVGIFGRVVAMNALLRDGDRVELYRPLRIDPKQARRRRAEKPKPI
jgi:putative ubiquitin-RnfH superfamily antitoxin RatB of RatAB toxin-antitoxin module